MKIVNINDLNQEDLYVCKDENIKQLLTDNGIKYINKTIGNYFFIKTNKLINILKNNNINI